MAQGTSEDDMPTYDSWSDVKRQISNRHSGAVGTAEVFTRLLLAMGPAVGWHLHGAGHACTSAKHRQFPRHVSLPLMQLLGPDGLPHGEEYGTNMDTESAQSGLLGPDGLPHGEEWGTNMDTETTQERKKLILGDEPSKGAGGGGTLLRADGSTPPGLVGLGDELDSSSWEKPADLLNFDPSFDPLLAGRPKYDLAAASGRPDEVAWGAVAAASSTELAEWSQHMIERNMTRALGLFTEAEAAERAADGTAVGYMRALVDAGFEPDGVTLVDPRSPGSRETILGIIRTAKEKKKKLCIHCADGTTLTGLPLADWIMQDYIGGGDNYLEAVDALAGRKRRSGIERKVAEEDLKSWIEAGHLQKAVSKRSSVLD